LPQAPQLLLSVVVLAQYSLPADGEHLVSAPQVSAQPPLVQTSPAPQACPQTPQLMLSVAVLAQ
jgi:hypothetical protein